MICCFVLFFLAYQFLLTLEVIGVNVSEILVITSKVFLTSNFPAKFLYLNHKVRDQPSRKQ